MDTILHERIEQWKKQLLDLGKRNRLLFFKEDNKKIISISAPAFEELWKQILNEHELKFPYQRKRTVSAEDLDSQDDIIKGDISTNQSVADLQKALKSLRAKARSSMEEQGINTLYLTFGILEWKERDDSSQKFSAPIILVPVKLLIESINSPYRLTLHEDEIVVNPTLSYKLNNDFGIVLPDFDSANDLPSKYLDKISGLVSNNGWAVNYRVYLTTLSFLKINMYKDLEKNGERINSNQVISALVGEGYPIEVSEELNNYDHDTNERPIDTYQVVDADSSQQDAILLSKKGASFVLQGPPGTGKSQTITNIIAEAIADGKKILFVSEKMAALQVVYNRLENVGLADFCLTLHSHKAKKKEILNNLANSINIDRTRVREDALARLDLLEQKRKTLNQYQKELHTKCSGLNTTIYFVNGVLAKLENVPDLIFSISDVSTVTRHSLNNRIDLLKDLSRTVGKRSEDYNENPWQNSTVKHLTYALNQEIDSKLESAHSLLNELVNQITSISSKFGIEVPLTFEGAKELMELLSLVGRCPDLPLEWITTDDIDSIVENAKKLKEVFERISNLKEDLSNKYNDSFFNIDVVKFKGNLSKRLELLHELLDGNENGWLADDVSEATRRIKTSAEKIDKLFEEAKNLAEQLGIPEPKTITEITSFASTNRSLEEIHKIHPTSKWFESGEISRIKSTVQADQSIHSAVTKSQEAILNRFDKEILEWDFYPVLQRFRVGYKSFLRVFDSQYRKDIRQLNSFSNGELSYQDAIAILNELKTLSDNQSAIASNIERYKNDYGYYYSGLNTQWNSIIQEIEAFEKTISGLSDNSTLLRGFFIEEKLPIGEILRFNNYFSITEPESLFEEIVKVWPNKLGRRNSDWHDIKENIEKLTSITKEFMSDYQILSNMRKSRCAYNLILSDLDSLICLNTLQKELATQQESIKNCYQNYFNGQATDWGKLIKALDSAVKLREKISTHNIKKAFLKSILTTSENKTYCIRQSTTLLEKTDRLKSLVEWFAGLFENRDVFKQLNLPDIDKRIVACRDKKNLLEEWVDYRNIKKRCAEAGLWEYLKVIEGQKNLDCELIVDAYLKRFYHLWMDAVLPEFPAVQNFRTRVHTQTINDFCELDKNQLKIAQARVREKAQSRIPDFNSINGARDEISILKRELNKQRCIMPLRKLFMAIPNLVTTLRPCFMMSPLSVSVFLEAKSYDFDMVIFDEASQVHTEDAIGAIMRGKQVIIVGDTNQLPPTNFFIKTANNDDFDVDTDENTESVEAEAFESILDEAVSVLPERSLRWHYRSRHEHLIAFSNIKVYNGQLITFPSPTEKAPDFGVEYIYVKDGVYDRGGRKDNVAEATKVAELVFEHFQNHPDRTLGVVTFSEAQQDSIDAAIRQKRLQNPRFDSFFMEDKEEPFFIKNLENVQGDERDTIIFSIGYAKDNRGIMYMNFGPLSRDGGYRRLNVAITRAKYNVKLVGSIQPTDIDIDRSNSEGVRMLRSYIEFAQNGIKAIEKELTVSNDSTFDSPFEESVYDFLHSKDYNVMTQVGCSGFRIDMAVKHPKLNGKFCIGIECDGASYHSSRTARERDRLRQAVLEGMGWSIYRIWSTDWIKDPKSEKEKLINAIDTALNYASSETDIDNSKEENNEELPNIEIEEKVELPHSDKIEYGFEIYKRASISGSPYDLFNFREVDDILLDIIRVEQPIHFDEICKRIYPALGRQKVTSFVRDEVRAKLTSYTLGKQIQRDKKRFVRMKDNFELKVRIPDPDDDYIRPINNICDEELALAMKTIVQKSFGITPDDLILITAREFGFKRTGENINRVLNEVYKKILRDNVVEEIDGKISVVK